MDTVTKDSFLQLKHFLAYQRDSQTPVPTPPTPPTPPTCTQRIHPSQGYNDLVNYVNQN